MSIVTLLQKARNETQTRTIKDILSSMLKDLQVEIHSCTIDKHGWIQASFTGEDEEMAKNYLVREIGACPTDSDSIGKFSTLKGYITSLDKQTNSVIVDIGILSSDDIYAKIPLCNLQAQLADGRKLALSKIAELFGLCERQPVVVKILDEERCQEYFEARFAERQIFQYTRWIRSLLDRLMIIGASRTSVRQVLKKAKCARDVAGVEPLGLLEQVIVCKLGTNAVGLIPKIGRLIPNAYFSVFSPVKILDFFGDPSFFSFL